MSRERDKSLISERYLMHEYAINLAYWMRHIMWDLGSRRPYGPRGDELGEDLIGRVTLDVGKSRPSVNFSNWRYSPGISKFNYHHDRAKSTESLDGEQRAKPIENHTDTPVHRTLEHEVVKRHLEAYHMDQTFSTEITSRTKVSGNYGGASVEQELEVALGFKMETGTSGADETTTTEKAIDHFTVKPDAGVLPVYSDKTRFLSTPYEIDAYIDVDVTIWFEREARGGLRNGNLMWGYRAADHRKVDLKGIAGILRWLNGYDIRWPRMSAYAKKRSGHAEDAWRWIENDQHRRVTLDGTKEEQFKTNGAVDFRPLDIS